MGQKEGPEEQKSVGRNLSGPSFPPYGSPVFRDDAAGRREPLTSEERPSLIADRSGYTCSERASYDWARPERAPQSSRGKLRDKDRASPPKETKASSCGSLMFAWPAGSPAGWMDGPVTDRLAGWPYRIRGREGGREGGRGAGRRYLFEIGGGGSKGG